MNLTNELNRVLRYSMETVKNLLGQLHARPEARHPQPAGANSASNEHTLFRNIVADALDDAGRSKESKLLRDNSQHVVVAGGRVRAGRPSPEASMVATDLHDLLDDLVGEDRVGEWHSHDTAQYVNPPLHRHPAYVAANMQRMVTGIDPDLMRHPEVKGLLKEIVNAPYEEIDTQHPSERRA